MNNAATVTLRSLGCGPRAVFWPQPLQVIRGVSCLTRAATTWSLPRITSPLTKPKTSMSRRLFSSSFKTEFQRSNHLRRLKQYDPEHEDGLTFREQDLNDEELQTIFTRGHPDPYLTNRLLKVLHARRIDGTLDLPLDFELSTLEADYPNIIENGLNWLNTRYPIDTDAAILARFQREEAPRVQENPSFLLERGQRLGLFKPQEQIKYRDYSGPQSGQFYAELSEKQDDVFGKSELERIRKVNEAKAEEEQRKFDEEVERRMQEAQAKAQEKSQALAERPDQGIEVSTGEIRPPNLYEQYVMRAHQAAGTNIDLDSPEVKNMTFLRRVVPSLLFVLAGCGALYLLTEYWNPPRRSDRMFPDTSLAIATVGTILAMNFAVFVAWRIPSAWKVLNRYFLVTPGYPRMFSMLGNTFSHYSFRHLSINMLTLLLFAPSLHEDIGRANFLAIYLASGLIGSWFSMTTYLARGILYTSHQGASGSTYGIVAAYLYLHRDSDLTLWILPESWRDWAKAKGSSFLWGLIALEILLSTRRPTTDVMAHLVGIASGVSVFELLSHSKRGH